MAAAASWVVADISAGAGAWAGPVGVGEAIESAGRDVAGAGIASAGVDADGVVAGVEVGEVDSTQV